MKYFLPFSLAILCLVNLPGCKLKNDSSSGIRITKTEKGDARQEIEEALEFEFNMTKDPTGKIPENVRFLELEQARTIALKNSVNQRTSANAYAFQGPDNLGGRTRTIVFDSRYNGGTNRTILAGGISGGVWKSTDNGATWVRKSPLNQHFSCTSLAQDPRLGQQDTWYYTTGEAIGNSASATGASYSGNGVYKSIDNGETWSRLVNSNITPLESFSVAEDYISKVVVSPNDGYVYIAATSAIKRSTDGGATWSNVLNGTLANSNQITDIIVTSTGRLYAAFSGTNVSTVDGVWTSASGNTGSWTRLAGTGVTTNPIGWDAQGSYRRVVLGMSPGSENILYILYATNLTSSCSGTAAPEAKLFRYNSSDSSWANLSGNLPDEPGCSNGNDPFAVQGGYDMVVAVHPINPNIVLLGGTNAYRSMDGFTTTAGTKRIGGYASPAGYANYANSHADIHVFAFVPGSSPSNAMLCGNDGGVQRTEDVTATTVTWTDISRGFRTYQYYYVAIDPRPGNAKVLGGAQDNGSTRNTGGNGINFEKVLTGDGVSVGLSDTIAGIQYEYVGSQNGVVHRRRSTNSLGNIEAAIKPSSTVANGLFVTLFHLDNDNTQKLYYVNNDTIYKTAAASTVTSNTWTKLKVVADSVTGTSITALATTRGPYNGNSNLFFGSNNGKVYRIKDPSNADSATSPVNITGAAFPVTGYVSSISVNPRNDDTLIVTFSNYGVTSVFWTGNANSATPVWQNVEGGLTLPSYRSSAIAIVDNVVQYFVGTSVGLFKATINGASPAGTAWVQEGADAMGNAVVSNLKLRVNDNTLLIGTHGYGMWKTSLESGALPVTISTFSGVAEKASNTLYWTVKNEVNSKGYYLERRYKNQVGFSSLGFVSSDGSGSNTAASYNKTDNEVDLSVDQVLYRLKQEDKDGSIRYSSIVTLNRKPSPKLVEYISANKNELLIRMNNVTDSRHYIRINDMEGRLLIKQNVTSSAQHIPIAHLSSGAYLVQILTDTRLVYVQKFIK